MKEIMASSGLYSLDELLDGLRYGDNVVWQIDRLDDYLFFAENFLRHILDGNNKCIYFRFAPHQPIVLEQPGLTIEEVDSSFGFIQFSENIHEIIGRHSKEKFFIFDNLSTLVEEWATDELLANFFQITCPYLCELETIAYFALTRGRHANSVVARIRDTTQVLIDVYHYKDKRYIHPLKVWDRYSPQMFIPHLVTDGRWLPVFESSEAAAISQIAFKEPLRAEKALIAPWDTIYNKLLVSRNVGGWHGSPEAEALTREFSRMLIGRNNQFSKLTDRYFDLDDLINIRDRMIGTGRIGGKATGMLLARKILVKEKGKRDFTSILEEHDSFYIGSDVFFTFLIENNLFRQRLNLFRQEDFRNIDFEALETAFLEGIFPMEIMQQFQHMLEYFGQAPIIVRSSSLLEDSFGNAFAGKYRSEFCPNQGSPDIRLEEFLKAVKMVYASTLSPDVLSYRLKRGLENKDEQMAILVQRVSGRPYRDYFFPWLAGVAFSRNPYAWSDAIDSGKGVVRLVLGLGTRAVNRVSNDYPRMIALSKPEIRPETVTQVIKNSQHHLDLLDIKANSFNTKPIAEAIQDDYPGVRLCFSLLKEGYLYDPPYKPDINDSGESYVLTFNRLIKETDFVGIFDEMLSKLDHIYGHPVDTEFTATFDQKGRIKVNLLQCRPLMLPGMLAKYEFPKDPESAKVLFKTSKVINGGKLENISYIIWIPPLAYAHLADISLKRSVGRYVGILNRHPTLREKGFILMGPGRWGSSNINLGVNVSYADINNALVLIEIASGEAGFVPELSYGTHFFQDLVEDQIIYLPVYPDLTETAYNSSFFEGADNEIGKFIEDSTDLENTIKVINVTKTTRGLHAILTADSRSQKAICYLG